MRSSFPRRSLAAALLGATVLGATMSGGGCLSPTLPLPPPDAPRAIRQGIDGTWTVVGDCSPGALVTVFIEREGVGAVVEDRDADGHYSVAVKAERCDVARIWQQDGEESSASQDVVIQEVENGAPLDGSECVR